MNKFRCTEIIRHDCSLHVICRRFKFICRWARYPSKIHVPVKPAQGIRSSPGLNIQVVH